MVLKRLLALKNRAAAEGSLYTSEAKVTYRICGSRAGLHLSENSKGVSPTKYHAPEEYGLSRAPAPTKTECAAVVDVAFDVPIDKGNCFYGTYCSNCNKNKNSVYNPRRM